MKKTFLDALRAVMPQRIVKARPEPVVLTLVPGLLPTLTPEQQARLQPKAPR